MHDGNGKEAMPARMSQKLSRPFGAMLEKHGRKTGTDPRAGGMAGSGRGRQGGKSPPKRKKAGNRYGRNIS